ncbi:glycosyltransferase, partial [Alphaproteobacteria bacterium]|nr:glycosyltransferase [Alphaproteobacteria bacterium]
LFVGRLVPYKGLNVLLDALKFLQKGVTVRIVGSGLQTSELHKMIASVSKRHKVVLHGSIDDAELEYLFTRSTVFCLPSVNRLEAFGVVLLEAMRTGCPTIAADIEGSGVPWVNSCGLNFENSNPNALAEVLDRLLGDVNLRQKIAEENFRSFSESFTDEIMCERFLNLYKELLSCKKLSGF